MTHPSTLLKRYKGRAQRRYGQHFLASQGIVDKICDGADLNPESRVLEIGPGLGVLTETLLDRAGRVLALELDSSMIEVLTERFGKGTLELHHGDASKIEDWSELVEGGGWVVVANLPYNIGTGILTSMLGHPESFSRLVLMRQKEVAERILAPAGDRKRGSLSVYCQTRARVSRVVKAPPGAFYPPPKVDSWVIRLDLLAAPEIAEVSPAHHERVVQAGFSAPRKTIRNGLSKHFARAEVDAALASMELDSSLRPAALSGENWVDLARLLGERS
jgi:16S rRNA (adenine1518-N6/adenine1519-N6)-dimethyltransferase